ncbi:MetQ/NlpA family ABC transporter substrate-binding protein [Patulibacter sp. NPDC049589]|uniref:MetQ/NlpA family ABC transporter substrate-binding protein n=1 Tax=Patulibacter sp. NPDC049589 TaxID=3154731 RepID=UPI00343FB41D
MTDHPDPTTQADSATDPPAAAPPGHGFEVRSRRGQARTLAAIVAAVAVLATGLFLVVDRDDSSASLTRAGATLKVAWMTGDPAQEAIVEEVRERIAPDYGIRVEGVPLDDSTQLNRAVSDGRIAGTIYQHQDWLDQVLEANPGFRLQAGGPGIFHWRFGVWSDRYRSTDAIPDGATISLTSDPANLSIGLSQLAKAGLIRIHDGVTEGTAQLRDIDNPRGFKWKLVDFASQPRVFRDVDASVSSFEFFLNAGVPASKAIFAPLPPERFAGILTIGSRYAGSDNIKKLVAAFHDPRLQEFIRTDPRVRPAIAAAKAAS